VENILGTQHSSLQAEGKAAMVTILERAQVLMEALPYIRAFYGKCLVVKYGGHAMAQEELKRSFAMDVVLMKYIGMNPVIVHGGGPQIGDLMQRLGKVPHFVQGMRVTDAETMDIVEMVLGGKINKEIVGLINQHGGRAVGLSGKDGGLIKASRLMVRNADSGRDAQLVDIGLVGRVESINPDIIQVLDSSGYIPIIAPIGVGEEGEPYNINADLVAGEIASALKAEKLIVLTDVEGIMDEQKKLISSLKRAEITKLIEQGVISEGMLPKVEACLTALDGGVRKSHIIDGRQDHALLLEVFTDRGIGTEIVAY
jgi:acetylglutamate kinase